MKQINKQTGSTYNKKMKNKKLCNYNLYNFKLI